MAGHQSYLTVQPPQVQAWTSSDRSSVCPGCTQAVFHVSCLVLHATLALSTCSVYPCPMSMSMSWSGLACLVQSSLPFWVSARSLGNQGLRFNSGHFNLHLDLLHHPAYLSFLLPPTSLPVHPRARYHRNCVWALYEVQLVPLAS